MEDFKNFPSFEEDPEERQEEMVIMAPDQIAEINNELNEDNDDEENDDLGEGSGDPGEGDAGTEGQEDTSDGEGNSGDGGGSANPEEDPLAKSVYTSLVEKGIFQEDEDFDGTFDNLEKYFDELPNKSRASILEEAPTVGKELVDFVIKGGNTLTNEDVLGFMDKYRDSTTETEVSDLEAAEQVVRAELTKIGFDEEQIELNIDLLKGKGDETLMNKAKDYQAKNKPNLDAEIAQAETNRIAEERAAREFTTNVISTLEEQKYTTQRKKEIKEAIRSERITDTLIEAVGNPKALIQLANLVLHYDSANGFDLKEFAAQVASKDIKKMKDKSFADNFNTSGSSGRNREQSNDKDKFSNIQFVNP